MTPFGMDVYFNKFILWHALYIDERRAQVIEGRKRDEMEEFVF